MIYRSDTRSVLEPPASVEKPSVDKNVKPQKDPTSNTLVVDNSLQQAEHATAKTKSNSIIPNSKELGRQIDIKTIKYKTVPYVPKKEVSQTTIVNSINNNIIQPHCNNNINYNNINDDNNMYKMCTCLKLIYYVTKIRIILSGGARCSIYILYYYCYNIINYRYSVSFAPWHSHLLLAQVAHAKLTPF